MVEGEAEVQEVLRIYVHEMCVDSERNRPRDEGKRGGYECDVTRRRESPSQRLHLRTPRVLT